MPLRLDARSSDFPERFEGFLAVKRAAEANVDSIVAAIVEDVRRRGDAALIEYTKRYDRVEFSAECTDEDRAGRKRPFDLRPFRGRLSDGRGKHELFLQPQ